MIAPDAILIRAKLGVGNKIYKAAEVIDSELGDKTIIGNNAIVNRCQLEDHISVNRSNYLLRSSIGRFTYTGIGCSIRSARVGRYCSLAWNVSVGGGNHEYGNASNYPRWRFSMLHNDVMLHESNEYLKKRHQEFGDCEIGNDVWLATNSVVIRGVRVGDGSVIGAGAIVTKHVEPYSIVVGSPGRVVKKRFDDRTIEALESIRWWDWPLSVIQNNLDLVFSTKVDAHVVDRMRLVSDGL